ncbi:MAG TPA: energy transducer TonB [Pyrinomonadaceae bacterium]|nr:energy transducer TonB [Pyrinomonadaceae bacterium]
MRGRISKAKALIAVRNYNGAIYELENIRRETGDQTVHGVVNVLLMNCFLEQGDYKRAQTFLSDLFNAIKSGKPNAAANYYAAAGQVIKGAKNQSERFKSLGLSVSDRNLEPLAVTDLESMRQTLEKVIENSKVVAKDPKQTANAFALLEEAGNARGLLARDDFDSKRWKDEVADSREMLANSSSTVFNAMGDTQPTTVSPNTVASNNPVVPTPTPISEPDKSEENRSVKTLPVPANEEKSEQKVEMKPVPTPAGNTAAKSDPQPQKEALAKKDPEPQPANDVPVTPKRERRVEEKTDAPAVSTNSDGSIVVGSLLEYAVQRSTPVYPANARSMRQTGVVRVEVLIDENGQVASVQNTSGPVLLQNAARDAVRKWKFKPFVRDGQPVKATGYLSFNFNL